MSFAHLYPKKRYTSIYEIDFDELKNLSIEGLIIDIDNTLVSRWEHSASMELVNWMQTTTARGFKVCLVSNSLSKKRVQTIADELGVPSIHMAGKPFKHSFLRAGEIMNLNICKVAVIGDQLFTDVYGGNKLGIYTILINPIDRSDTLMVKARRILEKFILGK